MIVRLKDQQQLADGDEGEAARLLTLLSASEPDPRMESRVYARLMAQPGRAMGHRHRRLVFACVGLLLVSTTILAAVLTHRWRAKVRSTMKLSARSTTELAAVPQVASVSASEGAHRVAEPVAEQLAGSAADRGVGVGPPAVPHHAAPVLPSHPIHPGTAKRRAGGTGNLTAKHDEATLPPPPAATEVSSGDARSSARSEAASEAQMAAAPSEEATLVLAALRALRRSHDPVKAGALLEQYLTRFPHGVLVEEALALGMEAALDRRDAAAASRLAGRYVQSYPTGRFTDLARRAMRGAGP